MAETTKKKSVFETLNAINVNDHTEKKNGLTYLSWAWAWSEAKKLYPTANYKVYEREDGCNYFTDGNTCWVKAGVIIEDLEHIEYLPIMDYKNRSIPLGNVTSFDVNKAIQRSLTKALARHGLGLYIYAGEDLPEDAEKQPQMPPEARQQTIKQFTCANCGNAFADAVAAEKSMARWGKHICLDCIKKKQAEVKRQKALAEAKKQTAEEEMVKQALQSEADQIPLPFEI